MATINKIPKVPPLRFPDFNDEWTQCCISDYGDIVTGSTPSTSDPENYQENGFLWASPADINESKFIQATKTTLSLKGFNSTRKLPPYTVLVVCIGSTIGKMAMSKTIMATNQQINSIVVCEKYSPEFVYYAIDSRFPQYLTSVAVQAVPIISKSTFGALESCAPSLAEQKKIADFLSLIDERIQSCSETIRELKNQKAALLNQLFSQKLRFPDYSNEWTTSTISKVCKVATGSMNTQDKVDGGDYPFYVRSSTIERSNRYTYDGIAILTPGDGAIGKIFHYSEGKIAVHQRVYILSEITIDAKYLFYYFSDKFYNRVIRMSAKNTVDSVRRNMITDMPLSLPSLAEQKKIADFLSLIDERIEVEEQLLKKYEEQKKYLLRNMFV